MGGSSTVMNMSMKTGVFMMTPDLIIMRGGLMIMPMITGPGRCMIDTSVVYKSDGPVGTAMGTFRRGMKQNHTST